jgi:hypothetical protein
MVPIDPDDSLAQQLEALGDIDAYSRKLSSGERVRALFPKSHSEDNLHIVVQLSTDVSFSASRKHSRSGTEEDGQAVKRKEIEGDPSTFIAIPCRSQYLTSDLNPRKSTA